jgi:ABC-2 type transport system permease protein
MASRSWWIMLILIGPLVGISFIDAVRTYGELSGYNGTAAGVGEAFSPLVGIWAPTFSACELVAAFLLPFVVIRLVAGDRHSGALKLEMQRPLSPLTRIGAKAVVLLAGWVIATMAPLAAVALWRYYGGDIYPPELATVAVGHLLNAGLTVALASAAGMIANHPSTAAIATLSVTVGTWVLDFIAAVHGGIWARLAEYTPIAMVAQFQHGLIRLDLTAAGLTLIAGGLALAAVWMQLGRSLRVRVTQSLVLGAALAAVLAVSARVPGSWDLSENRMNSFPLADEHALSTIQEPLRITVYLAPEDPRRTDLERNTFSKLRRVMPDFDVTYVASTGTGLFEQTREHYGELHYRLASQETVNRTTTVEGVLESIYSLAHRDLADTGEDDGDERETVFRGHPLAARPTGAAFVFYGAWPAVTLLAALRRRRRGS